MEEPLRPAGACFPAYCAEMEDARNLAIGQIRAEQEAARYSTRDGVTYRSGLAPLLVDFRLPRLLILAGFGRAPVGTWAMVPLSDTWDAQNCQCPESDGAIPRGELFAMALKLFRLGCRAKSVRAKRNHHIL